jgi:hypothetical protein
MFKSCAGTKGGVEMEPDSKYMVIEKAPRIVPWDLNILCVKCGWEGVADRATAPWIVFMSHNCLEGK